ncbi:MAG TPA: GNAT family N-acetyltransferase [Thermoanaerobaculia bacterium]|nr:GNAT family N-acetyltransferase [Thermoanaerobaculia bacterium]
MAETGSLETLSIRALETDVEAQWCARLMSSSEPWVTLGRSYQESLDRMRDPEREHYVALLGSVLAGFLVLSLKGSFVGYIQTVCVAPEFRNRGIGTRLVEFAEKRILPDFPNVFICVSSFNHEARKLYEDMGYKMVGALMDFLVRGHSELLLRKTTGPIGEFRKRGGG